jgi:hypothetical protein
MATQAQIWWWMENHQLRERCAAFAFIHLSVSESLSRIPVATLAQIWWWMEKHQLR